MAGASRTFHTSDRGLTWDVTDSQIPAAPAGGVFSLAFKSIDRGVAVGGDFTKPRAGTDGSAATTDSRQWAEGGDLSGYRSVRPRSYVTSGQRPRGAVGVLVR